MADVIDTTVSTTDAPSDSVLAAIMTPKKEAPVAKEEPVKEVVEAAVEEEVVEEESDKEEEPEEKKAEEPEDIDEYLVDLVVDGKPVEVKLKDLKADYSGRKYAEANIQKAVETRKAAETETQKLFEGNKAAQARLQQLDTILSSFANPKVDWAKLKETDPNAYLLKREEQREAENYQAQVRNEAQKIQAEQDELASKAKTKYLKDEADQLVVKLPELADPEKAEKVMGSLVKGAKEFYGYEAPEVQAVMDHRAFLVLSDAVKWRQHLAKKAEVLSKEPVAQKKITLRTQAAQPAMASEKKLELTNLRRAQDSGRPEDIAKLLIVKKAARK